MKTVHIEVTYHYELEINEQDEIVKEYNGRQELLEDCANYRFGTGLPVIAEGGVKIMNIELMDVDEQ